LNKFTAAFALVCLASTTNLFAAVVETGQKTTGLAAVYTTRLNGHKTASGQIYNSSAMTAANQTLPFGTKVRVTNVANHKSAVVRINDRGPVQADRIVDLSSAAAHKIGMHKAGLVHVEIEVLEQGSGKTSHHG
jgi:rare lipoprotein A